MLTIREAIVVEGRYDKNTLSQVVDTLILETNGFGIFKDPERMSLLRRAAERSAYSAPSSFDPLPPDLAPCGLPQVAGLHRAVPSATLDKVI